MSRGDPDSKGEEYLGPALAPRPSWAQVRGKDPKVKTAPYLPVSHTTDSVQSNPPVPVHPYTKRTLPYTPPTTATSTSDPPPPVLAHVRHPASNLVHQDPDQKASRTRASRAGARNGWAHPYTQHPLQANRHRQQPDQTYRSPSQATPTTPIQASTIQLPHPASAPVHEPEERVHERGLLRTRITSTSN